MKAKTFIEYFSEIKLTNIDIQWQDRIILDKIKVASQLYSRPFKSENITDLFEGWGIINSYFDEAGNNKVPTDFYHQLDNRWIRDNGDDFILGYRWEDEFVEEFKFPHPGNIDNFLTFVSNTWNKKLDWKEEIVKQYFK